MLTFTVGVLAVLVVLELLAIGDLRNRLDTLRRRHEALLLNVGGLQTKVALLDPKGPRTLEEAGKLATALSDDVDAGSTKH